MRTTVSSCKVKLISMTFLILLLEWHYRQLQTSASLMAFSQSALFLDTSFKFLILQSLTSVSTQFHHTFQVAIIASFIFFHCLRPFYSVWLPRGHNLVSYQLVFFFLRWQVVELSPNPQPGGPVHRIYKPRGTVVQLYPQAPGTNLSRLLRPTWTAVGLFFSTVTKQGF